MIQTLRYLFFVWMSLFFTACVTMRQFPIETLQPAKLTIESPKKHIAICASETVLSESIATNETAIGISADSLITNILISFQRHWEEAPGYEDAQFNIYINNIDELPGVSNFDLMVQLDRLQVKNIYYGQEYGFDMWEAYLCIQYLAKWSVRNKSGMLIDEYTYRDLLVWPSGIHAGKAEAVDHLPDVKDAWWDMGIEVAQNYAVRLAPQWQTGMRDIYMVNKFPELSQRAFTAMQNEAYPRAFNIWESMLISCHRFWQKKTKSQITYNMAVAYEFQNQLDQAIHWAEQSAKLKRKSKTVNYLKLLREREQYQTKLDLQTSNPEPETLQ